MDLLRRHLFFIVCGGVGAAGIVLGVLGIGAMSKVSDAMQAAASLEGQIGSAKRTAKSEQDIQRAQQHIDRITGEYKRVLDLAKTIETHKQLLDGFFPAPSYEAKYQFPDAYRRELDRLLQLLNPGELATEFDIDDEREQIEAEDRANDATFGVDPREAGAPGASAGAEEGPDYYPSGLIMDEAARRSPEVRAAIKKAQRFYCYANLASLDVNSPVYNAAGAPPRLIDCWDAQQSLWVQEKVVDALARINNQAAEKLKNEKKKPWVGTLPVKDVISLRVSGYVYSDSEGGPPSPPGGMDPALPPGSSVHSFTDSYSDVDRLVIHFTLKLAVDVRDLPTIIAELSKDAFTTLFRVDYSAEPDNLAMEGKIYGAEPVVNVVLDFETCFFCRTLAPLMPDEVGHVMPQDIANALTQLKEEAEAEAEAAKEEDASG